MQLRQPNREIDDPVWSVYGEGRGKLLVRRMRYPNGKLAVVMNYLKAMNAARYNEGGLGSKDVVRTKRGRKKYIY